MWISIMVAIPIIYLGATYALDTYVFKEDKTSKQGSCDDNDDDEIEQAFFKFRQTQNQQTSDASKQQE